MTDDLARTDTADTGGPIAVPYVQITETAANQDDVAAALDTRDAVGRVPVLVRVRQRPPLRVELFLIAGALALAAVILPAEAVLRVVLTLIAAAAVVAAFVTRMFLRVPAGSVGLVMKGGRHSVVLPEGIHRVNPLVVLTHVVTTREIAFDVPVSEVRSSDGVAINVDLLLTLGITDPARFVYSITPTDLDQLAQAATQDAVRKMIRGIEALAALDLGTPEADALRATIDGRLADYGVAVRGASFTRVTLPGPLTASLEARRLASVQLDEERETHALAQLRLADQNALFAQEAEARRTAVEHEASAEALRLARLEERLTASPNAARYDLEAERLRVAQQLATNTRAVVSFGAGELVSQLLVAGEGAALPSDGAAASAPAASTPATSAPAPERAPAGRTASRAATTATNGRTTRSRA
ncbi:MAG TPA: SPFH domain-containing protein [Candidatus Limnocylindrales bacterium]|nr:SPFH domain-containing protein [Candidatus Limnocylindrales bacterium]